MAIRERAGAQEPERSPAAPGDGQGERAPAPPAAPAESSVPRWLRAAAAYSWRILLVVAALAALVFVLSKLLVVVVPVIVALVLTTVLEGPVRWLRRRGLPQFLAALLVLIGFLAVIAGLGFLIERRVSAQFDDLNVNLQQGVREVGDWIDDTPLPVSRDQFVRGLEDAAEGLTSADTAIGGLVGGATLVVTVFGGLILLVFVLFFLLKDGERVWRWFVGQWGPARQGDVDALGSRAWQTLREYFRGVIVIAIGDTLLIGLALLLVGVPLVLPLMVLTFAAAFFPILGAFTAGFVAVMVALVSGGVGDAAIMFLAILAVQQFEGNVLYPLIMRQRVHLHPLATVLVVTSGGVLAGVFGAFIAVPLVATTAAAVAYLRGREPAPVDVPDALVPG